MGFLDQIKAAIQEAAEETKRANAPPKLTQKQQKQAVASYYQEKQKPQAQVEVVSEKTPAQKKQVVKQKPQEDDAYKQKTNKHAMSDKIKHLLKSKKGLKNAILLKEVLDKPLSLRRR